MAEKELKRMAQVGVIVEDIDKAIEAFSNDFGVTEWNHLDINETFGELLVDGEPAMLNIKVAINTEFGIEIELVQPTGEGKYMDWLREHGPGVHHMAFTMPNKNAKFDEFIQREFDNGRTPWIRATEKCGEPGQKMNFAYLDRRADMGVILEMYGEDNKE